MGKNRLGNGEWSTAYTTPAITLRGIMRHTFAQKYFYTLDSVPARAFLLMERVILVRITSRWSIFGGCSTYLGDKLTPTLSNQTIYTWSPVLN